MFHQRGLRTFAHQLGRSGWDQATGGQARTGAEDPEVMPRLCVDEKGMGHGHSYLTIVARAEPGRTTVEHVGEGRQQSSLDAFWQGLQPDQLAGIAAVAMDMWPPYVQSTLAHVPAAARKIVHDPFHLVKYMNEAVNEVRKNEHRRLQAQGCDQLKNTRNLWLYGPENLPATQAERFAGLKQLNLQTARAWALKEVFRTFWSCPTVKVAERYFARWYRWAIRCRLTPVKKVARLCQSHLPNLLTFFEHRLTNGPMEGLNNAIQGLIKKAFGYRNKERFKTDILFHFGGLKLYPNQ